MSFCIFVRPFLSLVSIQKVATWYMICLLFLLQGIFGDTIDYVETLVGERVTLVPPKRCLNEENGLLFQQCCTTRLIAKLTKSHWYPAAGYEARFSPGNSVEFTEAMFNDNGMYLLKCNSSIRIDVKVLVPYDLRASLGESVNLPCYFNTGEKVVKSVRWKRGSELVMEQWFKPRKIRYGDRFRGRVTMLQDAESKGDLSLNLQSVHSQDQGKLFCQVQISNTNYISGEPTVIRLRIKETNQNQSFSFMETHNKASPALTFWTTTFILSVLPLLSAVRS